jgi:hypothetical protein
MRLAFALALLLLAGCLDSRERLDPPRIYLKLNDTDVASGGEMSGVVSAYDTQGIVYVSAELKIDGDPEPPKRSYVSSIDQDTVDYSFGFTVKSGFPSGTRLFITAIVVDEQNFQVSRTDTAFIR